MIIVDANAMAKLALEEKWSAETRRIVKKTLSDGELIGSPSIAIAEALNALWKHNVLIKDLKESSLLLGTSELLDFWENVEKLPIEPLASAAVWIAKEHKLTVYDAFYVVAAINNKSPLLTFDNRIIELQNELGIKLVKIQKT